MGWTEVRKPSTNSYRTEVSKTYKRHKNNLEGLARLMPVYTTDVLREIKTVQNTSNGVEVSGSDITDSNTTKSVKSSYEHATVYWSTNANDGVTPFHERGTAFQAGRIESVNTSTKKYILSIEVDGAWTTDIPEDKRPHVGEIIYILNVN